MRDDLVAIPAYFTASMLLVTRGCQCYGFTAMVSLQTSLDPSAVLGARVPMGVCCVVEDSRWIHLPCGSGALRAARWC